jgi:UDP-N-acetylglucosamine 2-epimerase (non-hydrolysing)
MNILVVFGTRPEALKCFPVVNELRKKDDLSVKVCVTAQHRHLLDQILQLVDLVPDYDLDLMRAHPTLTDITADVLSAVGKVLDQERPDRVLVQGDTTTTMATALAAFYRKIRVGHIEAGLRSWDNYSPWPEEVNRKIVSAIADLHFAPTVQARDNLLRENIPAKQIRVTGNTSIDALFEIRRRLHEGEHFDDAVQRILTASRHARILLVTVHRRENWGKGLKDICAALLELAARGDIRIVLPVHPNPNVHGPVHEMLGAHPHITLIEPLDYLPFIALMDAAYLVLTDSGGVQEEAPALGKPVLVLRNTTERPEGIAAGNALLVGTSTADIATAANRLLDDSEAYRVMSQASNPYGDGTAAAQIVEFLLESKSD